MGIFRFWFGERTHPSTQRQRLLPPAMRLVIGLALLIAIGTALLLLPGVGARRNLQLNEAFFTATSAFTVTGLSIIEPINDLSGFGLALLLTFIQIGGVGFMVIAVIIFRLLGRKVLLLDRLALRDSFGLLDPEQILNLTRRVLITVLIFEALGALALWIHWRSLIPEPGRRLFYALFHAVSAFCNAGFDLFTGHPNHPSGVPGDNTSLLILGVLILLGSLGIPVLGDLLTWHRQRRISLHSRLTLSVIAILVVVGSVGIFLGDGIHSGVLTHEPVGRRVILATFQSVSARTAGIAGFETFSELNPSSQLLLIVLMFIGSAPASMGGGITTGTFVVLVLALWSYARGLPTAIIGGRSIEIGTVRRAAAVLTISLFVVLTATWLILLTHSTTLDAALFEVVSAFATCGLSLAFTGQLTIFGQIVIALVMFWGRLGALTIIMALTQSQTIPRITYPEEQILIG